MFDDLLQRRLLDLFAEREVELEPDEEGWLLSEDGWPAIRATWHEAQGAEPGRLDIDVALDEDRRIEESLAGEGEGEAGVRDALSRFESGLLPVLLAACWYVTDDRTLDLARWELGVRGWDVFLGRWMLRGELAPADVPADVASAIETAMQCESLSPGLHVLRLFHACDDVALSRSEVLLDNAPWSAGTQALAACHWPTKARAYRAHRVVVLDVCDY
ncbi:DUF6348 family protein [Oleiagrimonas soli]|uniref:Uncharacterized protein n=1 Tax=Oleiagrimonas soli TaxID=1543381 RepID=A0A099CUN1_9GAMM|nr:DUF6348 family protein [Oleiagrimonas soli]KGI77479.1 hypothetical protein LF63_0109005 [Oleiagrimonas soli]MBB6183068.1 hypothetical protein [Oleiagrimonas soli]